MNYDFLLFHLIRIICGMAERGLKKKVRVWRKKSTKSNTHIPHSFIHSLIVCMILNGMSHWHESKGQDSHLIFNYIVSINCYKVSISFYVYSAQINFFVLYSLATSIVLCLLLFTSHAIINVILHSFSFHLLSNAFFAQILFIYCLLYYCLVSFLLFVNWNMSFTIFLL
jgi:hypothetical protein